MSVHLTIRTITLPVGPEVHFADNLERTARSITFRSITFHWSSPSFVDVTSLEVQLAVQIGFN
jgi:hypothetical protein